RAGDRTQDTSSLSGARIAGTVFTAADREGVQDPGEGGRAGRPIQLFNDNAPAAPVLVDTTTTNANGNYRFTVFDGLRTGNYQVIEVVPGGWGVTTANPRNVNIPRGETFRDVDFGNVRVAGAGLLPAGTGASSPTTALLSPTSPAATGTSSPVSVAQAPSGTGTTDTATLVVPAPSDGSTSPTVGLSGTASPSDGALAGGVDDALPRQGL